MERHIDMQLSANKVKGSRDHTSKQVFFTPIPDGPQFIGHKIGPMSSDKAQLRNCGTHVKPHPPMTRYIRNIADLKENSPKTNATSGYVLKVQHKDRVKANMLQPFTPMAYCMMMKPGSEPKSGDLHFDLPLKVTQVKLHTPQTKFIRGGTDCKESGPQTASPYLNQSRSKSGYVLKVQQKDRNCSMLKQPHIFDVKLKQGPKPPSRDVHFDLSVKGTSVKLYPPQTRYIRRGTYLGDNCPQSRGERKVPERIARV